MNPLTDGRHRVARSGQKTIVMWACHNDREEDLQWSPRESRVTVAPSPRPVNTPTSARNESEIVVEMRGLEPLTPSLQRRCSPS